MQELYFYTYKGVKKPADLSKPVDKRIYKGTSPTCHDINKLTISSESVMLLVGFTGGQIQLVDPIRKEIGKLYNEEVISLLNLLYSLVDRNFSDKSFSSMCRG